MSSQPEESPVTWPEDDIENFPDADIVVSGPDDDADAEPH